MSSHPFNDELHQAVFIAQDEAIISTRGKVAE
jgi:hypothetical protein